MFVNKTMLSNGHICVCMEYLFVYVECVYVFLCDVYLMLIFFCSQCVVWVIYLCVYVIVGVLCMCV